MKTNLTTLLRQALEGRGTPSRGLDMAADYIAEHFRNAGLEPIVPTAVTSRTLPLRKFVPNERMDLRFHSGGHLVRFFPSADEDSESDRAIDVKEAPVLRLPANGAMPPVAGRVVAGEAERYGDEAMLADLSSRKPALILLFGSPGSADHGAVPRGHIRRRIRPFCAFTTLPPTLFSASGD